MATEIINEAFDTECSECKGINPYNEPCKCNESLCKICEIDKEICPCVPCEHCSIPDFKDCDCFQCDSCGKWLCNGCEDDHTCIYTNIHNNYIKEKI